MKISNTDDVIDSRDVIARIEELQDEQQTLIDAEQEAADVCDAVDNDSAVDRDAHSAAVLYLAAWRDESAEELAALLALQEEAEGYAPDWKYGCALIRDSYFTEYMDDMLQDIGDFPKNLPSYLRIEVDYEALQMDYASVEFDGVTYWVR